jgi:GPH family glycoside/pentoside/hexuronide:cation symporter
MNNIAPSRGQLFQYGILALPLAFAGLPLYLHIPDYYTREMGVHLGIMGVALLFLRLLDTIQDPFFGYICDRWPHKKLSFLCLGFFSLLVGMGALMYGPPSFISTLLWLIISLLMASAGLSILSINLTAIGGLWKSDNIIRIRISSWRECFGLIGLLIAAMLPPVLQKFTTISESFQTFYMIFFILMVSSGILFYRFFINLPLQKSAYKKDFSQSFLIFPSLFKEQKSFYVACFLTHLAASFPAVLFLFFVRDYLQAGELTGGFLALYFFSGVIFMPLWVKVARFIGAEKAWLISIILACTVFIWAFFINPDQVTIFSIICVLSGIALGADLALPPALLARKITASNSEAHATQNYALLNLMPKLALAFASGIAFLVLSQVDFKPGFENTQTALYWVVFLYALLPSVIKAAAGGFLYYSIQHTGDYHDHNQRSNSIGLNNVT